MRVSGPGLLLAITIGAASCSSPEPKSPLILGGEGTEASLGLRNLTIAQASALKKAITSAGEPCGAIKQAILTDIDPPAREAWEVQCTEATYSVRLRSDGTPTTAVEQCLASFLGDARCADPFARRHDVHRPAEGPLNPELKKLLDPMTAKDGKTD